MSALLLLLVVAAAVVSSSSGMARVEKDVLRARVAAMFDRSYDAYMRHAYPADELKPLSCSGHQTWVSSALTLLDALDTLAVLNRRSEFERAVRRVEREIRFDRDLNVSVFETNIRLLGSLLSSHLLASDAGAVGFAGYDGALLRLALDLAERLLVAFDTPTGIPYGTVNLLRGVPVGEIDVTCTAGGGTFLLEFGLLSRLTGDRRFEFAAQRAALAILSLRSARGLVGNHVNITSGEWTVADAGLGHGVDSFYEYLAKAAALFGSTEYEAMFRMARVGVEQLLARGRGFYVEAHLSTTAVTWPVFNALQAFWPGVLAGRGRLREAAAIARANHDVWLAHGGHPERAQLVGGKLVEKSEGYYLRPEHAESIYHLSRACGAADSGEWLRMAADVVDTLERRCRVPCGYASLGNVETGAQVDRMDSFWLAETLKYLYLTFADDTHWAHARPHVFNTEAHLIPYDFMRHARAAKRIVKAAATAAPAPATIVDAAERAWLDFGVQPAPRHVAQPASAPVRTYLESGDGEVSLSAWHVVDLPSLGGGPPLSYRASAAQFGPPLPLQGLCGSLKWMTAPNGCEAEPEPDSLRGLVAVAARGGCAFAAKAVLASAAGAVALIIVDSGDSDDLLLMAPLERAHLLARAAVRAPALLAPRQAGAHILHLLNTSQLASEYAATGDASLDDVSWRINARVCLRHWPSHCDTVSQCRFGVSRIMLARMAQLRRDEATLLLQARYSPDDRGLLRSEFDAEQHRQCYYAHPFDLYNNASARQQSAAFLLATELTATPLPVLSPQTLAVFEQILAAPAKRADVPATDAVAAPPPPPRAPVQQQQQQQPSSPPPPPPPAIVEPEPTPVPPGVEVAPPVPANERTIFVNGVLKQRQKTLPLLAGVALPDQLEDALCIQRSAALAGATSIAVQCEPDEYAQTGGCRGTSALFANHPQGDAVWVCEQMIAGVIEAFITCCYDEGEFEEEGEGEGESDEEYYD